MGGDIKDQLGRVVDQSGNTAMPAVILVNPQLGQNIGAACRAMLNFGLTELRLVKPRDGWPNPDANAMAAGAVALIDNARVFETTAEAVADLKYVLAATARRRELEVPVIGTGEVGAQLHDFAAGVFLPRSQNRFDETKYSRAICTGQDDRTRSANNARHNQSPRQWPRKSARNKG